MTQNSSGYIYIFYIQYDENRILAQIKHQIQVNIFAFVLVVLFYLCLCVLFSICIRDYNKKCTTFVVKLLMITFPDLYLLSCMLLGVKGCKTNAATTQRWYDTNLCYLKVSIVGQGFVPQIGAEKCRLRLDIPNVALLFVFVIRTDDFFAIRCGFACNRIKIYTYILYRQRNQVQCADKLYVCTFIVVVWLGWQFYKLLLIISRRRDVNADKRRLSF